MKVLCLTLFFIGFFTIASVAQDRYITQEGHLACHTREDLDKLISYNSAADYEAARNLEQSGKCMLLEADVEVQLMDSTLNGLAEIRPIGKETTIWTIRDAIKRK